MIKCGYEQVTNQSHVLNIHISPFRHGPDLVQSLTLPPIEPLPGVEERVRAQLGIRRFELIS